MSIKRVGSCYYTHKSNLQELLDAIPDDWYKSAIIYEHRIKEETQSFPYEVIKYDTKQHKLSFINSHNWDTAYEPEVGDSVCLNLDTGNHTWRKGGTTVYHSKELFVADDYTGFDIQKAKERTALCSSLVVKDEKKLIGNKIYWIQWCKDHNIEIFTSCDIMIRAINWQYSPVETSWLYKEDVANILKVWEHAAKQELIKTNADHVVYAYKKYITDKDGNETFELNLMLTPLNNEEFYKRTASFGTDYLVYALHNGTN